ncbi:MAG: chorismate--pyruvate lyase family protein [Gammaproteobacteria bacterium]
MQSPPQYLLPWLTCTTYLTEKLFAKSGDTRLQVCQQIWEPANDWDRQVLALKEERVLHRDIVTYAWDHPCWFARSILPETTYQNHLALFERLNDEPLGNLIFHTTDIQRLNLKTYLIGPQTPEYTWLPKTLQNEQDLWLRSSIFQVKNAEQFCLIEILLPDLERYCEK